MFDLKIYVMKEILRVIKWKITQVVIYLYDIKLSI